MERYHFIVFCVEGRDLGEELALNFFQCRFDGTCIFIHMLKQASWGFVVWSTPWQVS